MATGQLQCNFVCHDKYAYAIGGMFLLTYAHCILHSPRSRETFSSQLS